MDREVRTGLVQYTSPKVLNLNVSIVMDTDGVTLILLFSEG